MSMAAVTRLSCTAVCLVGLLAAGCRRDPELQKKKYVASGDNYAAQGKLSEAILQYRNAVKVDPRFGEARLKLGDAYMKSHDVADAYGEYVRAADLLPQSVEAQIKAGGLCLLAQKYEDARS